MLTLIYSFVNINTLKILSLQIHRHTDSVFWSRAGISGVLLTNLTCFQNNEEIYQVLQ